MKKWEYMRMVVGIKNDGPRTVERLNKLGREGWEIVGILLGAWTIRAVVGMKI